MSRPITRRRVSACLTSSCCPLDRAIAVVIYLLAGSLDQSLALLSARSVPDSSGVTRRAGARISSVIYAIYIVRSGGTRSGSAGGVPYRRTPSAKLNACKARSFKGACAPPSRPRAPFLRRRPLGCRDFPLGQKCQENTRVPASICEPDISTLADL